MLANLKFRGAFVALICIVVWSMANGASAVTVEVAKKCEALTAKAFPPREIGNPAAGSAKGSAQDKQNYYNKCLTNGGNMDDHGSKDAK